MEIPYTVANRRDTGLFNSKVGIWLFLASEVMLFGGLFSGYVFLRLGVREGVDLPWPIGMDVHKSFVWLGFANTIVLIASSVFVVMAWACLKLREWRKYQIYMGLVLACAAVFMVNKFIEYNSKLNHHYGVYLKDGMLLDGALVVDEEHGWNGDKLQFRASSVDFNAHDVDTAFLNFAKLGEGESLQFVLPEVPGPDEKSVKEFLTEYSQASEWSGETRVADKGELKKWLKELSARHRREEAQRVAEAREKVKEELIENAREAGVEVGGYELYEAAMKVQPEDAPNINLALEEPAVFEFKDSDVFDRRVGDDFVPFFGQNRLIGEMVDDRVDLEVHSIDARMVRGGDGSDSQAWDLEWKLGGKDVTEEVRQAFKHYQEEEREIYQKKGQVAPADRALYWRHVHLAHGEKGDRHKEESHEPDETGGEPAAKGDDHHGKYPIVSIPRGESSFMASHGPRFGTYYAIYFTMTGLHGLHVVGGAVVLAYFLFRGRKLYQKNPEHLANRVEVGGLFWHFVDLVWIFLFPIMYLF